ncbi:MAG: site-2 protease family protein [Actinomycetota bacterium]
MRPSIRLGTLFGIPIGLHWSIVVIVGLVTFGLAGTILPQAAAGYASSLYYLTGLVISAALLASIVAHELGHALVARRNGVGTRGISLFALGGVAELESEADNPGAAARIAAAGPAVSVAIGAAAMGLAGVAGFIGASPLAVVALTTLGFVNLVMAVFNMIPALPLDGGRVLQAALWQRRGDRESATVSAAGVGRFLGWSLVAFGLWQFLNGGAGLWTMVIGWFVVSSARAEELRARFRIRSRTWAPPQWHQRRPTGTVIDVTARPVAPPTATDPWSADPRPTEPQRVP